MPSISVKTAEVYDAYFKQTGVADAVRRSLRSLFSEAQLPDNPYFYIARVLGAYVDQSQLWQEPSGALLAACDADGAVEVADAAAKLCKLTDCSHVWGLPHVLRVVSRDGANIVADMLTNSLPDSFFPGPMPTSTGDGYTVQALASVQGPTALWCPRWQHLPALHVRCDVLVRGPALDTAAAHAAALVAADVAQLHAVPVHVVEHVALLDAPTSTPPPGVLAAGPVSFRPDDICAAPEEWCKASQRALLRGKVLQVRAVVLLDTPQAGDGVHQQQQGPSEQGHRLRYLRATKTYHLHYAASDAAMAELGDVADAPAAHALEPAAPGSPARHTAGPRGVQPLTVHLGCGAPHEALYEGYFLSAAAAKQSCALFASARGAAHDVGRDPYADSAVDANATQLAQLIEGGFARGDLLAAFRRQLLLVLLHEGRPLAAARWEVGQADVAPLEDVLEGGGAEGWRLAECVADLLRIAHSGAAAAESLVTELEALATAAAAWPLTAAALEAAAAAAVGDATTTLPQGDSGCSIVRRQPELLTKGGHDAAAAAGEWDGGGCDGSPASMLAWMQSVRMEVHLVGQLVDLRPRVIQLTGRGTFAGISLIVEGLLRQLPDRVPPAPECTALLAVAQPHIDALLQLLRAASLTLCEGLLDRCPEAMQALRQLRIKAPSSGLGRGAGAAALAPVTGGGGEDAWVAPEWVLSVEAVTEAQVRSGALAARAARAGVMLQYAVDTQLDALLASVWRALVEPPLAPNPFPRVVGCVRARAAHTELWKEDMDEVFERLLNPLTLLAPPQWLYCATAARAGTWAGGARRTALLAARGGDGAGGGGGGCAGAAAIDDDELCVWGAYSAVMMSDVRALHVLAGALGALLGERHWQEGAYAVEVVPALVGDAPYSSALALADGGDTMPGTWMRTDSVPAAAGNGGGGTGAAPPPFEHPRFVGLEAEHHFLVSGPRRRAAAVVFAQAVVAQAVHLHRHSPHILLSLDLLDAGQGQGGGAPGPTPSPGGRERSYGPRHLTAPATEALTAALVEVVLQCPPLARVATLRLLAAPKEGVYARCALHLFFCHAPLEAQLNTRGPATLAHREGEAGEAWMGARATEAPARWDRGVYARVFLSEAAASRWAQWHQGLGDPGQPFHVQAMVADAHEEVCALEGSGDFLGAQRLLLLCALAEQQPGALFHASLAMRSTAQELRCLHALNEALVALMGPANPAEHWAKLDTERVRRLLLAYTERVHCAFTSSKHCYFSGFSAAAPQLLAQLREQVLGSFRLDARMLRTMTQLNTWTRCCECSVAACIHDSYKEQLRQGWGEQGWGE